MAMPTLRALAVLCLSLLAAHTALACPTQCTTGPCGPGHDQCGAPLGPGAPQFHVRDRSCAINDPNFPFYDARHGMYHLFYQDHLAEAQGGLGAGPVIGHAVSRDLV
jgi:sucrose-6-phosphate hydrolase SacC (GH32 family)